MIRSPSLHTLRWSFFDTLVSSASDSRSASESPSNRTFFMSAMPLCMSSTSCRGPSVSTKFARSWGEV
jgi:hypothetical protein